MRTGVKQEVIRMTVAIKIRHTYQVKAHWKSRATRPSDMNIATHVPNRCLASARIVKDKIRLPIVVKVSCWTHAWLPECEKSSQSGGKGASHSARSKFIDGVSRHKQIARAVKCQSKWSKPRCKGVSRPSWSTLIDGTRECLQFR